MLRNLEELKSLVKNISKKRLCVVFAHDLYVLEAIKEAMTYQIIDPILIGNKTEIISLCNQLDISLSEVEIIDDIDTTSATKTAMDLVNLGKVDIIMKGLIDTKFLLKGVVNNEYGIKAKPVLSHVGLIYIPGMDRVLFASDGAMLIQPSVEEKIAIVENAAELTKSLGYSNPKIGIVSSVEKVNPKIESTVHAEIIKNHFQQLQVPYTVDGPFAIDNLVSMESVRHKGIISPVAGIADVLIFPNLDAGNVFYKTVVFLAHGESAGIVMGAKVPIIVTSRADTPQAKLNSILLAVVNHDGLFATNH